MSNTIFDIASKKVDGKILYITKFGSKLYGTETQNSDTDYKCIFIPNPITMLLGYQTKTIQDNTSDSNSKNTKNDIDFEYKSIQQFLKELKNGDTGAVDIAFSYTNKDAVIYMHPLMNYFFNNIHNFFNIKNMRSFLGYAQGQAQKYSINGERLYILENVKNWLDSRKEILYNTKILDFYEDLLKDCQNETYCMLKRDEHNTYIHLLGSDYMLTNSYRYFSNCIDKKYNSYGERARKVKESFVNNGVSADWKALSHAYRCISEMKELLETKNIIFPLRERKLILDIKLGKINFDDVMNLINKSLDEVNTILANTDIKDTYNKKFSDNFVINMYNKLYL